MCGRFTLRATGEELARLFELDEPPPLQPRYNVAPTQPVAAVRASPDGQCRELALLRWGLIPPWASDPVSASFINARAETAAGKPAFRGAFRARRCLIPADGFYEWRKGPRGKEPFLFQLRGRRPFAFAGLWERWRGPDGVEVESCAILTTEANDLVRELHDRMPVILAPEAVAPWLDPAFRDLGALQELLRPLPAWLMEAHAVSARVNNAACDGPACAEPLPGSGQP